MRHIEKFILLVLVVVGGAVFLAPIIMAFEPERVTGDFILAWGKAHYAIPVLWSLCASAALGLLYLFYRR